MSSHERRSASVATPATVGHRDRATPTSAGTEHPAHPPIGARRAIVDAERQAIAVVQQALRELAVIRARTQRAATLVLVAQPPARAPRGPSILQPARATEPAAERVFSHTATIDIHAIQSRAELDAFCSALASISGVLDVAIAGLKDTRASFELTLTEPTRLIAELQARAPEALYIQATTPFSARLEIYRDV